MQISLDDFGTGYSSLAYLHRFPSHSLKIDQSFVRDIKSDRDDAAIVSTVISLARQLNPQGARRRRRNRCPALAFLRVRGCDSFQGYLFRRPQPAADIDALLRRHRLQFAGSARKRRPGKRAASAGS